MNPTKLIALTLIGLWIGQPAFSQSQPLRIYELRDWNTYKNANYITSATEGPEYVYFGSSGGVLLYHKFGRYWDMPFTSSNGMQDDFVTAVLFDNVNYTLWAAHRKGVSYLRPGDYRWNNIQFVDLQITDPTQIIRMGDNAEKIWLETNDGRFISINKLGGYLNPPTSTRPSGVNWAPCRYDSIPNLTNYNFDRNFQFDARGSVLDNYQRTFPMVLFYINSQSDVFGGTWGLGAFEGNTLIKFLRVHPTGPLQNPISAMVMTTDWIWLGSDNPLNSSEYDRFGLAEFNRDEHRWDYFESGLITELASATVNDLLLHKGYLCVATDLGLAVLNLKRNHWRRFTMAQGLSDECIITLEGTDSLIWIGTPRGLSVLNLPKMSIRRFRLDPAFMTTRINKIKADGDVIWFATGNGLYSLARKTRQLKHYDQYGQEIDLKSAVAGEFGPIAVNATWAVFSRTNGLLAWNKQLNKWLELPMVSDLANLRINDLTLYNRYLWIATDSGAVLLRLPDFYYEHYTTQDGLADNQVRRILIDDELVWFGTAKGLTSFKWRKYVTQN